ncbi:uncharacterized protein PHALS_10650 [Plasmopara halstedii]|uniref:Uncharacterized protein n=1 Tax=Plasmopara halstedii TaxID=4781 RepID=A0A0N7L545_PLAHL|nr:uncharacterized protein PHALS_10650 [Plasmopara halstedii]CEG40451.1 hypothetical protein PHALS_10650 [Plasmopara halstedii]|eukprot:XP_024576820.1 hypothetical protein PHALS_10650 [Plasmopara halstedii]
MRASTLLENVHADFNSGLSLTRPFSISDCAGTQPNFRQRLLQGVQKHHNACVNACDLESIGRKRRLQMLNRYWLTVNPLA